MTSNTTNPPTLGQSQYMLPPIQQVQVGGVTQYMVAPYDAGAAAGAAVPAANPQAVANHLGTIIIDLGSASSSSSSTNTNTTTTTTNAPASPRPFPLRVGATAVLPPPPSLVGARRRGGVPAPLSDPDALFPLEEEETDEEEEGVAAGPFGAATRAREEEWEGLRDGERDGEEEEEDHGEGRREGEGVGGVARAVG